MYKLAFWLGRLVADFRRGYRDGLAVFADEYFKRKALDRVQELVNDGCYVQAIKEYRAAFGATLVDAKHAVDAMGGKYE